MVEILALENGDGGGFSTDKRLEAPKDIMVMFSTLISLTTTEEGDSKDPEYNSNE